MQRWVAYIFALYFSALGLSPLWGAHIHHTFIHSRSDRHPARTAVAASSTASVTRKADRDENDQCRRFCDDCMVESVLEHLLENKTFLRYHNPVARPAGIFKHLTYALQAVGRPFVRIYFVAFATEIPPPGPTVLLLSSLGPRAPPAV